MAGDKRIISKEGFPVNGKVWEKVFKELMVVVLLAAV